MVMTDTVQVQVCPTYVGMNRRPQRVRIPVLRMPHVCGDEPYIRSLIDREMEYAPRMWG